MCLRENDDNAVNVMLIKLLQTNGGNLTKFLILFGRMQKVCVTLACCSSWGFYSAFTFTQKNIQSKTFFTHLTHLTRDINVRRRHRRQRPWPHLADWVARGGEVWRKRKNWIYVNKRTKWREWKKCERERHWWKVFHLPACHDVDIVERNEKIRVKRRTTTTMTATAVRERRVEKSAVNIMQINCS